MMEITLKYYLIKIFKYPSLIWHSLSYICCCNSTNSYIIAKNTAGISDYVHFVEMGPNLQRLVGRTVIFYGFIKFSITHKIRQAQFFSLKKNCSAKAVHF